MTGAVQTSGSASPNQRKTNCLSPSHVNRLVVTQGGKSETLQEEIAPQVIKSYEELQSVEENPVSTQIADSKPEQDVEKPATPITSVSTPIEQEPKRQLIEVSTAGNQIAEQQEDKSADQLNEGQPTHKIDSADTVKQQGVILQADEVGELVRENEKLREALLRQTSIQTADRIQATEFEFTIPKEMYEMVKDAMDKSKSVIFVRYDENKKFVRAEPDVYN